ncbi:MAG: hypothetical protein Q9M13_05885, partial [Mariprofundales bacterium]|nr:hypothetical protein [Mariprofundales bacterium]
MKQPAKTHLDHKNGGGGIAAWPLKRRLALFWLLFLGSMAAAGATHEASNLLTTRYATQLRALNSMMEQVDGLRASIFAEHARHLMYLYTGNGESFDQADNAAAA